MKAGRIFAITAVTAAAVTIVFMQRATILSAVFQKGLDARLGADYTATLEDGLHLGLCGAGGPLPAPKASGPCVAVIAGTRLFVVDAGTDGARNLGRMSYPVGSIQAVFLTHFHSDHIDGLGEMGTLRWAAGDHDSPLPVHGPTGVADVVRGLNLTYSFDMEYRNAHHGDSVAPMASAGLKAIPFDLPKVGEATTIVDEDGLTVEVIAVDHSPVHPAVGYRFRYKGRSIVISGDTVKSDNIEEFAHGADLLVHEALAPNLVNMMNRSARTNSNIVLTNITHDILDYHTSPVEAAETARDAGVGHLLYYHIVPPLVIPGQDILFLNGADAVFPNYTIGQDGVAFSLPANSKEIIKTHGGL